MSSAKLDDSQNNGLSRRTFLGCSTVAAGMLAALPVRRAAAASAEPGGRSDPVRHPLDPLTAEEITSAAKILRAEKPIGPKYRFITIELAEPSKASLAASDGGQPVVREAAILVLDTESGKAFKARVDLAEKTVRDYESIPPGLQPSITLDEFVECEAAIKRSPEFLAALKKRGVASAEGIMIDAWSAGHYGDEKPEEQGKRLIRALAFVRSGPRDNGYARPLDGVTIVFDLCAMKVVRIDDYGVVPMPPEAGNWSGPDLPSPRTDLKPLVVTQPEGPSFTLSGQHVSWQKWSFRIGYTPREGLVLHTITYRDGERERPILHRASICEMVVPYADPAEKYCRKNAFDMGEYGVGLMTNSLNMGCDCLGSVQYLDAHIADGQGRPVTMKNVVCVHEEDCGVLWKHTDWRTSDSQVRRSRRLSVSCIATVGNYDYGFYWYFYQDGSIQCEVKLTGIMNTTSLAPGETARYGVEVAPRLNAPLHQHIFAARLDMSVDGPENSVYEVNIVSEPTGSANPHGNAYRAESKLLARESEARRRVHAASSRFWRIVNHTHKNRMGQPVAYRLVPGENAPPFVQPDAAVMKRAGFSAYHLWVTPHNAAERHAAGDYPNQHPTSDGLPVWTTADRPIKDTDLVAWYVFAHTHVPRVEDWPVMPVNAIGFWLRPDGFFERNPALDVPAPIA
jgi:primary-amine oxidase